jgi:hypothetical protein
VINAEDTSPTQVESNSTLYEKFHSNKHASSPQAKEQDQDGELNETTSQDQAQDDEYDQRPPVLSLQVKFIDRE